MRLRMLSSICCLIAAGTIFAALPVTLNGQAMSGDAPKKVLSPPAKVSVALPGAAVTIDYGAPSVRGRKIFGGQVPYDKVWRTGANPATSFKTTGALKIGDMTVPAGNYTLYTLPSESGWKLIINKQTGQWGTEYDEKQDLGRTAMMAGKNASPVEVMKIDFEKTTGSGTELHVKWADVDASVKVTAQNRVTAAK